MGHLEREFATYASAWLAMLAMLIGTGYALRAKWRDRHNLMRDEDVLHAHVDEVIHAHAHGGRAPVHTPSGHPVAIRR
jgi:hypothetical protein